MSDIYDATYAAISSKVGGCNIADVIRDACHVDASFAIDSLHREFAAAANAMQSPSVIYRPSISVDGDQWCALYGSNLQDGVCGFGNSPAAAMDAFDIAWYTPISPKPEVSSHE